MGKLLQVMGLSAVFVYDPDIFRLYIRSVTYDSEILPLGIFTQEKLKRKPSEKLTPVFTAHDSQ